MVLSKSPGDNISLSFRLHPGKANQHNAGVEQPLAENQVSKVLICGQQNCGSFLPLEKHNIVVNSRI
jgi:hypothetical protein